MKRIQSNTVELSLQDIVDKFKIKNVSNLKVTMTAADGEPDDVIEINASTAKIVLSFDVVKAEKTKKAGGRPKKGAKNGASSVAAVAAPMDVA